jgi:hypothetical protein
MRSFLDLKNRALLATDGTGSAEDAYLLLVRDILMTFQS